MATVVVPFQSSRHRRVALDRSFIPIYREVQPTSNDICAKAKFLKSALVPSRIQRHAQLSRQIPNQYFLPPSQIHLRLKDSARFLILNSYRLDFCTSGMSGKSHTCIRIIKPFDIFIGYINDGRFGQACYSSALLSY